jgi:hypothetical protein
VVPEQDRGANEETHVKLVAKWPRLRGYRYGFDVAAAAAEGESP